MTPTPKRLSDLSSRAREIAEAPYHSVPAIVSDTAGAPFWHVAAKDYMAGLAADPNAHFKLAEASEVSVNNALALCEALAAADQKED